MKIKELQTLLDNQPSVSANTFLVVALYGISAVLAVLFLILGIGLLLESGFGFKIFLNWVSHNLNIVLDEGQRKGIANSLGIISVILGFLFAGVVYLCKMILKRNSFIIHIEDWIYANLTEIHRTKSPKKGKK